MRQFRTFKLGAYIRWSLFSRVARLLLGRGRSRMLFGANVCSESRTALQNPEIETHLVEMETVSPAEIVEYGFPPSFASWFPVSDAFEEKRIFLFKEAQIEPRFGAVLLLDDGAKPSVFFGPSQIGFDVYMQGGMYEGMIPPVREHMSGPCFAFASCFAYYHELVEVMLSALQARDWKPDLKLLLHPHHPQFINEMLSFFGFGRNDIVLSERPVKAGWVVVLPHFPQRSAISRSDALYLRGCVHERLRLSPPNGGIYISRRKAKSRGLANERQLEDALSAIGFKICYFEEMPITEQFAAIAGSKMIVALHGSGLANIVAAQQGARVVEIISPEWRRSTFARLASELSLDYDYVMAECEGGHYRVDIDDVLKRLV